MPVPRRSPAKRYRRGRGFGYLESSSDSRLVKHLLLEPIRSYNEFHRGADRPVAIERSSHPSASTSSVTTVKPLRVFGPNVVVIATSAASRPRAINTRPMRGILLRASIAAAQQEHQGFVGQILHRVLLRL